MSRHPRAACALSAALSLLLGSAVLAHVTLETREAKAGSTYKAVLKLPHGCDGSPVLKVHAKIPEGIIAVKPMPKPGWQVETVRGAYGRTYPYFHGQQLSEGVREIVWTGRLPDEHYDEFVFSGHVARDLTAGAIYIPVTQTCEKGEIAWAEIPAPGQDAHALKAPAPALVILAQVAQGGHAHAAAGTTYKAGALVIEAPWTRATPGGAQVAGGYMKIVNTGKETDRLIGGTFPNAARFEVHEMSMQGDTMRMRPLDRGLEIGPGATVELKPGGYHVMFMGLKSGVKEGAPVKGTLVFEKAGTVEIEYRVAPIGAQTPSRGGGHKHH